jgi:hypothetical protein
MSKKLASLMDAVPPALIAADAAPSPPLPRPPALPTATAAVEDREVPLQVTIPKRVRRQLDRLSYEREETMRALILRAVRSLGVEVSDAELKDRRGRRS